MPINAKCPHCLKSYRFEDEQAGAVVKCDNPPCLKLFKCPRIPPKPAVAVAPPRPAPAPKPPAPRPAPKRPVDAETLAHQALSDEPADAGAPADGIRMTCFMCEHVFVVGFDKESKNVLCPECQHRQKVPEQRGKVAGDWRKDTNLPTLAKREAAPDDIQGGQATVVSNRALRDAGIFTSGGTLKPVWFWALFVGLPLALAGIAGAATLSVRKSNNEAKRDDFVKRAFESFNAPESDIPPAEAPIYRAALHVAAGHYYRDSTLLQGEQQDIEAARAHLQQARTQLAAAGRSGERNIFWGELLAAQVSLGGEEGFVRDRLRLRWEEGPTAARARINEKLFSVQEEVRQTLQAMADPARGADIETRLLAVRRLARELAARGKLPILTRVVHLGFPDDPAQLNEALCLAAIEATRAGRNPDAQAIYDGLKLTTPPASGPLLAKMLAAPNPSSGWTLPPEPPPAAAISDLQRLLFTKLRLLEGKPAEAVAVAMRDGRAEPKLRALAWVPEWAAEPPPEALDAAVKLAAEEPKPKPGATPSSAEVARVSIYARFLPLAAKANDDAKADVLLGAITDDGLRAWGKAEYTRLKLAAVTKPADEAAFPLPDDARQRKMGHAWGRLALARHNARLTGGRDPAAYAGWGKGSVEPFGLAGLALGLQDREK